MFVSAPIPQLGLPLVKYLETPEEMEECFELMSNLSTTDINTGSENFDRKLNEFIARLNYDEVLSAFTASFISYYFDIREESRLAELFEKIVINISNDLPLMPKDRGILQGIFTTCLINDAKSQSKKKIPAAVKEAIKYIESEGFITHLEEKHG